MGIICAMCSTQVRPGPVCHSPKSSTSSRTFRPTVPALLNDFALLQRSLSTGDRCAAAPGGGAPRGIERWDRWGARGEAEGATVLPSLLGPKDRCAALPRARSAPTTKLWVNDPQDPNRDTCAGAELPPF
jgi:hypothetical protein